LTIVTSNASHGLWTFHVNILIIIDTKKFQHKIFLPCDFHNVIWACNFLIYFFFFWILINFNLKTKVYFIFSSIKLFINTSHIFPLIIFSLLKDWTICNFHKRLHLWNEKKWNQTNVWWTKWPNTCLAK
jgi:hypothetical protein